MIHRAVTSITGISLVVLTLLFVTTTPTQAGPFGVLVFFASLYGVCLGVIAYILHYGLRLVSRSARLFALRRPVAVPTLKRAYYYASVIALGPVILLGLQSVGEMTVYEVFLVVLFVTIGCVYVAKRT